MKSRAIKYGYSVALIVLPCAVFSHGPHGGWILGFIISSYFGMLLSAAIWLLMIKGWVRILLSFLIPKVTLFIGIYLIKQIPEINPDWLSVVIAVLLLLLIYFVLIETCNWIVRKITFRQQLNA